MVKGRAGPSTVEQAGPSTVEQAGPSTVRACWPVLPLEHAGPYYRYVHPVTHTVSTALTLVRTLQHGPAARHAVAHRHRAPGTRAIVPFWPFRLRVRLH